MAPSGELARATHRAALGGDFRAVDRVLGDLAREGSAEARAWSLALELQRALVDRARPVPSFARSDFDASTDLAREAASIACASAERLALLAFDWSRHAELVAMHERLAPANDGRLAIARGWRELLAGRPGGVADAAAEARARGKDLGDPALVLEASALRAMTAAVAGDREEATALARRASRMARTEGLPQEEYLVNLVLARARRLSGAPHLAARILHALARYASWPWRAWIGWELLLAEGPSVAIPLEDQRPSEVAALWLRETLSAASKGDAPAYRHAARSVRQIAAGSALLARDLDLLDPMLDVSAPVAADHPAFDWLAGAVEAPPDGLHGVASGRAGEAAAVVTGPDIRARRVLSIGVPLACSETGATELPETSGRQARTESTMAVLALAGEAGVDENALFKSVYGFEFAPSVHTGVRDVLYHRVRQRAESHGRLDRSDGTIRLSWHRPVVIPDPRTSPPPDNEVLRVLARFGHASPTRTAEALGIPVRTAREILRRLADEGACRVERDGRKLEYHLDDTTFNEPTSERA